MSLRYWLLDLDRCLLDTNALHLVFDEIVRSLNVVDVNDIIHAKRIVEEQSGGSFDTAEFIQTELERLNQLDKWQDIEAEFIVASKNYDYLMPGAKELLASLKAKKQNHGIITYGGSVWQAVKIRAAGIEHIPHFITGQKNKGYLVADWLAAGRMPEALGGTSFDEVIMLDDKVVSFTGFPKARAKGFQVRTGKDINVDSSDLPANVVSIESLYDVVRLLETE